MTEPEHCRLPAESFLEWAFLRWVLAPATDPAILARVTAQCELAVDARTYRLDYEIAGDQMTVAVELDGYEFHSSRDAFTYDRLRQNDVQATGRSVIRFSYDAIRHDPARCVAQLQALLARDTSLAAHLVADPVIEAPDMDPDPVHALDPPPGRGPAATTATAAAGDADGPSYFDNIRDRIDQKTLRDCQTQAFA